MKQEKVIELAKNAGFGNYAFEAAGIFQAFAQLVEQEALVMAAAHLNALALANEAAAEQTCDSDNATWHEHAALVYMRSAESIMNLGDEQ